jgi:hypothetical protein
VAAIQHGVYGFRDWDGGDRLADVVLGWGDEVAEQIAGWPPPVPRLAAVGTPGLHSQSSPRRRGERIQRVLIATTAATFGSALSPWGFCYDYAAAMHRGVERLRSAGVAVSLRVHPAERLEDYTRIFAAFGMVTIPAAPKGVFPEVVSRYDLLISSISSVALEAARLGVPVVLWTLRPPPAVRTEFLLPPFGEDLPSTFRDEFEFDALMRLALEQPASFLANAHALATRLARYAEPFDPDRLAAELQALAE